MNDRQLKEDFLRMIRENKGLIFKVCNFYAVTPEDFRDIEQEILIQLWIAFPNYDDTFKYSTWIYRIALNTAISFQRKESRHRYTIGYDGAIFQIPDSVATDPELKLQIKQLYAAIDNLIKPFYFSILKEILIRKLQKLSEPVKPISELKLTGSSKK